MNVYTYNEYNNAGFSLPPAFELIPSFVIPDFDNPNDHTSSIIEKEIHFDDLFKMRFGLRLIGIEPIADYSDFEQFYHRLDAKAAVLIPEYVKKFEKYNTLDDVLNTVRTETTENNAKSENYVGAFNDLTGEPTPANKTSETKGEGGETKTYEGASEGERITSIERLIDIKNLYNRLLDEFEPLFLGVF